MQSSSPSLPSLKFSGSPVSASSSRPSFARLFWIMSVTLTASIPAIIAGCLLAYQIGWASVAGVGGHAGAHQVGPPLPDSPQHFDRAIYWKVKKKGGLAYLHVYPKGMAEIRKEQRWAGPTQQGSRWQFERELRVPLVVEL